MLPRIARKIKDGCYTLFVAEAGHLQAGLIASSEIKIIA